MTWLTVVMTGVLCLTTLALSHPMNYKMNENRILEADLVPVSSTVIPLPIYQVSSGLTFPDKETSYKPMRPVGPISLITSSTGKKKSYPKRKSIDEVSSIKEISKEDFTRSI